MSDRPELNHGWEYNDVESELESEGYHTPNHDEIERWQKPLAQGGLCPCCFNEVEEESGFHIVDTGNGEEELHWLKQVCRHCNFSTNELYD